eukprot:6914397-Pyramimonas_sp.AAC.1
MSLAELGQAHIRATVSPVFWKSPGIVEYWRELADGQPPYSVSPPIWRAAQRAAADEHAAATNEARRSRVQRTFAS